MQKEVVYFTKDNNNKVRVYSEKIGFSSENELKGFLTKKVFGNSTEKFYLIFDIKE